MLETKQPREQDGRDALSRYKAQIRAAAIASLEILQGKDIDRVYCDLHDDFVVRKNLGGKICYIFYQVKTKAKQNENWTVSEIFGLNSKLQDQKKQDAEKLKNSFVGKMLLHTVVFYEYCEAVVFQTNINNGDDVERIITDIKTGKFEDKFTKILVDRFNELFVDSKEKQLHTSEIKGYLSKIRCETDVQYLKEKNNNFESVARETIWQFSEIDLTHIETSEILIKLLHLVSNKSSGKIEHFNAESIEKEAGISIYDLLGILSISKEAYSNLIQGDDPKAVKNASIIQRSLQAAGAGTQEIEYCSRCKTNWDLWVRNNRHLIPELELITLTGKLRGILNQLNISNKIAVADLAEPIKELTQELKSNDNLKELNDDLILGGVFSELVRGKS